MMALPNEQPLPVGRFRWKTCKFDTRKPGWKFEIYYEHTLVMGVSSKLEAEDICRSLNAVKLRIYNAGVHAGRIQWK